MAPVKTFLTLREKMDVINVAEQEHLSVRKLGDRYVLFILAFIRARTEILSSKIMILWQLK